MMTGLPFCVYDDDTIKKSFNAEEAMKKYDRRCKAKALTCFYHKNFSENGSTMLTASTLLSIVSPSNDIMSVSNDLC